VSAAPSHRLASLDVFRGAAVAAMILVSTPGTWAAVYPALDHAVWHGWTPTDLVFPFFLFAMGAAIPFALERRRDGSDPIAHHVVRRALVLFALGLLLNAIEKPAPLRLATFRIPGVLQRIAVVYVIAVAISERLTQRGQLIVAAAALVGYWGALMLIPVPGAGAGVLTPAGNLASFIDRALFGRHMLTRDYDPEGLLSTVPATVTALLGAAAGAWLARSTGSARVVWLWVSGAASMCTGLAWAHVFPINKTLWTSSFTLFTAGIAAQVLALAEIVAARRAARWIVQPFVAFGRNPLVAYFLSVGLDSLLSRVAPDGTPIKAVVYRNGFLTWLRPCCSAEAASLAYATAYVALWGAVLMAMHKRGVFIAI
jgi:predicted acyltransferase